MSINNFIDPQNNSAQTPLHSSAYAKVAQGDLLGSTNGQTFQQRQEMHRNRQEVRHYGASMLAQGHMREETQMQQGGNPSQRPARLGVPARRPGGVVPNLPPRQAFREPPGRGYNPYG